MKTFSGECAHKKYAADTVKSMSAALCILPAKCSYRSFTRYLMISFLVMIPMKFF